MKNEKELTAMEEVSQQIQDDRVFLNNPLVMQGMGLAPMVVVASSAQNALMLAVAVCLLLTPTRVIAALLLRKVPSSLLRAMGYTGIAAVVYIGVYAAMELLFGTQMLSLGIYLPMLVVEPLIIYRFGRVPERVTKALVKGLRTTLGYVILLAIVGVLRELLAVGSIYGIPVTNIAVLPLAATPAGGFLVLGLLCAIWRSLANRYRKNIIMEARLGR